MSTIRPDDPGWEERFGALFRYAQVGRCVNGVTHDINNILGAIMAYAELVGLEADLSDQAKGMLEEVVGGVVRCTDLIGTLTSVARADKLSADITEPGRIAADVLKLRDYALRVDRIQLETDVAEGLPTIIADSPKVLMALIHLFMNAQESANGAEKKLVRFRLYKEAEGVAFELWDSGEPMDAKTAAKAFEPFEGNKGDLHFGYGLPAVKKIAELHEGSLSYDPKRGFKLYLPSRNKLLTMFNSER